MSMTFLNCPPLMLQTRDPCLVYSLYCYGISFNAMFFLILLVMKLDKKSSHETA